MLTDYPYSLPKTKITTDELRAMNDEKFLAHLRQFPYPCQWLDKEASRFADMHLSMMAGKKYMQAGNINSFKTTNLR